MTTATESRPMTEAELHACQGGMSLGAATKLSMVKAARPRRQTAVLAAAPAAAPDAGGCPGGKCKA